MDSIVYLHLGLLASMTLSCFSVLLLLPRWIVPASIDRGALWALMLTLTSAFLAVLYAICYVSNLTWGENVSLWIVLAHVRGLNLNWVSLLPYPHTGTTIGAAVLLLVLVSFRSFQMYRELGSYLTRRAADTPWMKIVVPGLTALLVLFMVWEARSSPWKWYGEPVTNFFGWPPVSSLTGFDTIRARAALEDLTEARRYQTVATSSLPNVVLIIVDSLRADHMSVYGYPRDTTPFLRGLDEAGKLHKVQLALSTCSETYCGVATIMASRHFHQVSSHNFKVFDVLERYGYKKRFFLSGDHRHWYYLQDFYGAKPGEIYDFKDATRFDLLDDRMVLDGLASLPRHDGQPHFIYCFLMSAHVVGTRQAAFNRWRPALPAGLADVWNRPRTSSAPRAPHVEIVNYYDNGVLQADHVIQAVFALLDSAGYLQNSIVVVTADHGDGLGEHGHFGHTRYLYQEDLHVPMLFYDLEPSRYQNARFATHVDISPTILHRLGVPTPGTWVGRSLLEGGLKDFSLHQARRGASGCRALVKPATATILKYIRCGDEATGTSDELYELVRDPSERENLIARADPAVIRALRSELDQRLSLSNRCARSECQ